MFWLLFYQEQSSIKNALFTNVVKRNLPNLSLKGGCGHNTMVSVYTDFRFHENSKVWFENAHKKPIVEMYSYFKLLAKRAWFCLAYSFLWLRLKLFIYSVSYGCNSMVKPHGINHQVHGDMVRARSSQPAFPGMRPPRIDLLTPNLSNNLPVTNLPTLMKFSDITTKYIKKIAQHNTKLLTADSANNLEAGRLPILVKFNHISSRFIEKNIEPSQEKELNRINVLNPECSMLNPEYTNCTDNVYSTELFFSDNATNRKNYSCNICMKYFVTDYELDHHIDQEHTCRRKRRIIFTCKPCELFFLQKGKFLYHKNCVHTQDSRNKCDHCGVAFNIRGSLKRHKHRVHTLETNFTPSIWLHKYFTTKNGLPRYKKSRVTNK